MLERATGRPFADILREIVFAPLDLHHTFLLEGISDWSTCVPGYGSEVDRDGRVVDVRSVYHPGWCAPGVAASNAEETAQVFDALFAGSVLKPATLQEMLTVVLAPGVHPPGTSPAYGMGIMSDRSSPHGAQYGHGGNGPGFDLRVAVLPETPLGRVSVAAFVNTSGGPRAKDAEAALRAALFEGAG